MLMKDALCVQTHYPTNTQINKRLLCTSLIIVMMVEHVSDPLALMIRIENILLSFKSLMFNLAAFRSYLIHHAE